MNNSTNVDWGKKWAEKARSLVGSPALNPGERLELDNKFKNVLIENNCEGIIAVDVSHFTYLSGVVLPYAEQKIFPQAAVFRTKNSSLDILICPPEWIHLSASQGWWGEIESYSYNDGSPLEVLVSTIVKVVVEKKLENARLGLDSSALPVLLVERIKQDLPNVKWVDCDVSLRELRLIKTKEEIKLLEEASRQADRAIISALNHMEGNIYDSLGYDIWEFTERIRVHVGEFGGSGTGNLTTLQGSDSAKYYRPPRRGVLEPGNLVRTEVSNHHLGYWSNSGRTFVTGQPAPEQIETYKNNIKLKNVAVNALRPGTTCMAVYQAVQKAASREYIDFWSEPGIGHGVGVSEREAPYIVAEDSTVLRSGMVLVLAIYTFGPKRELLCSKDTYEITEDGCRLLSWYKNWDNLYVVIGDTARHG